MLVIAVRSLADAVLPDATPQIENSPVMVAVLSFGAASMSDYGTGVTLFESVLLVTAVELMLSTTNLLIQVKVAASSRLIEWERPVIHLLSLKSSLRLVTFAR